MHVMHFYNGFVVDGVKPEAKFNKDFNFDYFTAFNKLQAIGKPKVNEYAHVDSLSNEITSNPECSHCK